MKIYIETIPHDKQRYPTVGDYFIDPLKTLVIRVSNLSNRNREFLVALHELIEAKLVRNAGISIETIDQFDKEHPGTEDYEPGDDPAAPYYREHQFAMSIERLMCWALGEDWNEYEKEVDSLFAKKE